MEPSPADSTGLYKKFLAERQEILCHKWIESEEKRDDIGFEHALLDWTLRVLVQILLSVCFCLARRLCRFYAARTAAQISGAVVAFPVSGLRLNCCFLIFSANSMPRIVTAAVSNRLNPSIGRIRCFIRR